jgi:hypothetical protein
MQGFLAHRILSCLWTVAFVVAGASCSRDPMPSKVPVAAGARPATDSDAQRTRQAAVTIRFTSGQLEPGSVALGADRLQVAAVFADIDRRDVAFLGDLVGQSLEAPVVPALDSCVRQAGLLHQFDGRPGTPPHAWAQLLDVGNVALRTRETELPLRVQMVPSLFASVRGVRYDADLDMGRPWLAMGELSLSATGGDGIAPFQATVTVPRPVRLTHVGNAPVRGGRVTVPLGGEELLLRWGSVDGSAELEVQLGAEVPGGLGWLRCRLQDDGAFTVPADLVASLPPRGPEKPWLVMVIRSREATVPGFGGTPLRLELTDRAYVY